MTSNDRIGNDTIAAIATAPGRGGIGVVRVSGPEALRVVAPGLRLARPLQAGRARRGQVVDPTTGEVLDEVVVTYFAAPRSYTTEDVVEISCHGAPVLLAAVLAGCLGQGARLAEPGEFTQRAYLAGRLDLTEAEAVHDLVAASTLAQAKTAAAQLGGSVARALTPTRQALLRLIAELEAGVDFAEDDLDLIPEQEMLARLAELTEALERLAATYRFGRVLHAGFTLAVAGRPNAGKSSLFNRLLGLERAIVTDQPGTTRDPIAETLELGGVPVQLVDTAGLRTVPEGAAGEPERQGIERSRQMMAEADVILVVRDGTAQQEDEPELRNLCNSGRPVIQVWSKADLLPSGDERRGLRTSAVTGDGLDALREAILAAVTGSGEAQAETAMITNLRQHTALQAALGSMRATTAAGLAGHPHELLLLDLYEALESLDLLTGATERDEVLNLIFSSFCIGK